MSIEVRSQNDGHRYRLDAAIISRDAVQRGDVPGVGTDSLH